MSSQPAEVEIVVRDTCRTYAATARAVKVRATCTMGAEHAARACADKIYGRGQYSLEQTGAASPEPLGPRIDRIMDDLLDIEYHSGCSARVEDMVHRAISFLESARIAVGHER